MNTYKVGTSFEEKCYSLIESGIESGELGIPNVNFKVRTKPKYYSPKREKDIEFDLSVEIWPPKAKRYSLLFIIECKSSPKGYSVPVDDVEEFSKKVDQVASKNVKAIMITDTRFASGGLTFAKNDGFMLIALNKDGTHKIILHRKERAKGSSKINDYSDHLLDFIKTKIGFNKVDGLLKLSADDIEEKVEKIQGKLGVLSKPIEIEPLLLKLKEVYGLKILLDREITSVNGEKLLGYFDVSNDTIFINKGIVDTNRFLFTLGHELGHYFLHNQLKMNQEVYDDFEDSNYDWFLGKHELKNDKNWIEWQANKFSSAFILPKSLFTGHVFLFRKLIGIRRHNQIYLDNQPVNQDDFYKTVNYLVNTFGVSKTSIIYRLEGLNLIKYGEGGKSDFKSLVRSSLLGQ